MHIYMYVRKFASTQLRLKLDSHSCRAFYAESAHTTYPALAYTVRAPFWNMYIGRRKIRFQHRISLCKCETRRRSACLISRMAEPVDATPASDELLSRDIACEIQSTEASHENYFSINMCVMLFDFRLCRRRTWNLDWVGKFTEWTSNMCKLEMAKF